MRHIAISAILLVTALLSAPNGVGQNLQARVEVAQSSTNFVYTLFNDEPGTSNWHVSNWHLEVHSPFQVVATPPGWDYATDNATYVDWFSTDTEEPYPHDIAPGASLGGFVIGAVVTTTEDLSFAALSWQHGTTNSGPSVLASTKAPSMLSFAANIVNVFCSADRFEFTVQGTPSLQYAVEVSANLSDWTQVMIGASPFTFQETPPATTGAHFFRVSYADSFGLVSDPPE